jgi:hypothetical protein
MKRARLLRWWVSLGIVFAGASLGVDQTVTGALLLWLFAFGVFWLVKRSAGKGTP